jgi:hypothetical protein
MHVEAAAFYGPVVAVMGLIYFCTIPETEVRVKHGVSDWVQWHDHFAFWGGGGVGCSGEMWGVPSSGSAAKSSRGFAIPHPSLGPTRWPASVQLPTLPMATSAPPPRTICAQWALQWWGRSSARKRAASRRQNPLPNPATQRAHPPLLLKTLQPGPRPPGPSCDARWKPALLRPGVVLCGAGSYPTLLLMIFKYFQDQT